MPRIATFTLCCMAVAAGFTGTCASAGVLLQGFYTLSDPNNPQAVPAAVPSKVDGTGDDDWWDHIAKQADDLRAVGFTAVWLPPPLKGSAGKLSTGYDPFDDYDIGSKNQKGTIPTHYGTRDELQRCVATLRANGIDVYLDMVENHRDGDPGGDRAFQFRYVDAFGNPTGGRFEKDPGDFHHKPPPEPNVPQDPNVFRGNAEGSEFGPDLAPINGIPKGHVFNGLIDAGDWLTRALDVQGYRLDDVKGISTNFMLPFLNRKSMKGKFAVGEFFDNADNVENWIANGMQGRASGFDYDLHFVLHDMCEGRGFFDMSRLDHAGLVGRDPLRTVTFVENQDTDTNPNNKIINHKEMAYAYILTSEGYPCVFYKDYSTDKGCFGLKPAIDNLIWIHEKLAAGVTQQRWKDTDVFAFERLGGPHLLVGMNDNEVADRTVTVQTGFGSNRDLHDYTGHRPDTQTDDQGRATITIPKDNKGLGFVCYSVAGITGGFAVDTHPVIQHFEGAADLDIPPADNTAESQICRVWPDPGKPLHAALEVDKTGWLPETKVVLRLLDPSGAVLGEKTFDANSVEGDGFVVRPSVQGFHQFLIQSFNTPPTNQKPSFTLTVTYTAPHKF